MTTSVLPARAVTAPAQREPVNKWLVTLSITFGTLMGAIDASIVNVAVPHLTGSLGATIEQITWVTTGFVIATVMVMPLTGFLARLFGFSATQSGLALMPRSLTMIVVMPIVGRLYNKVSPRLTVAFGIVLFAYTAWLMGHYTLATSARDVVKVLIIQGVAFSCLFIPLTTIALSSIPRHRLADATGLNSLLRQTGGSIGLAVFATLMSRFASHAYDGMRASIELSRPVVAMRIGGIEKMLQGRGFDPSAAHQTALRILDGELRRQAMVISFERLFYLAGILFLIVLPLVFFLRMPKNATPAEVHVEM